MKLGISSAIALGELVSIGSDTLLGMMNKWTASFNALYPNVKFSVTAEGSSTAPPALIDGTSHFGPMSRKMKSKELDAFEVKYGYKPTEVRVAIDALAVYVHKDNPVKGLSIEQVDAIFSTTNKCGGSASIANWGDIGIEGDAINLYGRNSKSGTYSYFKNKGLCKGDYKDNVKEYIHSEDIIKDITNDMNGVGYSGIGYKTDGVKAVPIAKKDGEDYIPATPDMAAKGKYPLGRYLYIYINKDPGKPIEQLDMEFFKYILSKEGQDIVNSEGFIPLPDKVIEKEIKRLH